MSTKSKAYKAAAEKIDSTRQYRPVSYTHLTLPTKA